MKIVQSLQVKNIYPVARIITKVYKNSKNKTRLKIHIYRFHQNLLKHVYFFYSKKQTNLLKGKRKYLISL